MRILFTLLTFIFSISMVDGQTIIAAKVENAEMFLTLKLYRYGTKSPAEEMKIRIGKGQFQQVIKTTKPILFELNDGINSIQGIIEPNDRILFSYDRKSIQHSFSIDGPGREKSQFLHQLNKTKEDTIAYLDPSQTDKRNEIIDLSLKNIDSSEQYFHEQLEQLKQFYTSAAASLLAAEIDAKFLRQRYRAMKKLLPGGWADARMQRYFIGGGYPFKDESGISPNYVEAVYMIISGYWNATGDYESSKTSAVEMLEAKYNHLKSLLTPGLIPKVLTLFIEGDLKSIPNIAELEALMSKFYDSKLDTVYISHIRGEYKKLKAAQK